PRAWEILAWTLVGALTVHLAFIMFEHIFTAAPTRHADLARAAIRRGPFARLFWGAALGCGVAAVAAGASVFMQSNPPGLMLEIGAALGLVSSFAWEYIWVEAGQSVPLS